MSILQSVQGHQFRQFIERYDAAKIDRLAQPPLRVQKVVAKADLVLASHRPRAMHTAELLGASTLAAIDPRFREIEFPVDFPRRFPKRFRLSALTWTIASLVLWRLGYGTRCESYKTAKRRASTAVDLLEHILDQKPIEPLISNAIATDVAANDRPLLSSTIRPIDLSPSSLSSIKPSIEPSTIEPPDRLSAPRSIVLVAHGGINKLIAKELRSRGWQGPRLPRSQHWGCTTYCR